MFYNFGRIHKTLRVVIGCAATLVFVLACWFGLRHEWGFAVTIGFASVIWIALVSLPRWVLGWSQ
jgi:hypothetical protein